MNSSTKKYRSTPKYRATLKKYNSLPVRKAYQKGWELRRKYGISLEAFNLLKCLQRNKCAICGGGPNGIGSFHVDHDHDTGAIRGLLCYKCNMGIGLLYGNLSSAEAYLS